MTAAHIAVDPTALRAASDRAAHDGWALRLAADELARVLARADLGEALPACAHGIGPIVDGLHHVADSEARLAEALGTLADAYRTVDGQHRPASRWG